MSVQDSHRQEQADTADTVWEPQVPGQTVTAGYLQAQMVTAVQKAQARTARAVPEPERTEKAALVQAQTVTAAQEQVQKATAAKMPERTARAARH